MRQTRKSQLALGEARIEDIKLDHKSRDDIPAVLLGLQHLYSHEETREKLFSRLEEHILPGTNRNVGRPGMELWRILVMGVLKQGLGCDFDRVHELVNQHRTVREFLGHGAFSQDDTYELQTIIDNVYLLTPELLSEIGRLVVESGHAVARKKPGEPLRVRCDSFVVETDVHYPTDVNLLWDAMRCLLRELGHAARKHNVGGGRWRVTRSNRSLQQEGGARRRRKCPPGHAISANGAHPQPAAWGVRPKAAPGGRDGQACCIKVREVVAGERGSSEPPRRLSGRKCGGECTGSCGARVRAETSVRRVVHRAVREAVDRLVRPRGVRSGSP